MIFTSVALWPNLCFLQKIFKLRKHNEDSEAAKGRTVRSSENFTAAANFPKAFEHFQRIPGQRYFCVVPEASEAVSLQGKTEQMRHYQRKRNRRFLLKHITILVKL